MHGDASEVVSHHLALTGVDPDSDLDSEVTD
jgi:hypothetical protein